MGRYETSNWLKRLGVVSGRDMTMESAITKMMHLMGQGYKKSELKSLLEKPLRGEIT